MLNQMSPKKSNHNFCQNEFFTCNCFYLVYDEYNLCHLSCPKICQIDVIKIENKIVCYGIRYAFVPHTIPNH